LFELIVLNKLIKSVWLIGLIELNKLIKLEFRNSEHFLYVILY